MEDIDWEVIINRVLDLIEKCIENRSDKEIVQALRHPKKRSILTIAMAGRGRMRRLAAYRALAAEVAALSEEDALLLIEIAREA